ncbi:hypothetical protein [Curtobacterium sp. Leaf261]|uniref:hypothetical protein n=1 Tax=Curtobacterium sp. Leaf261 TaxID=1736311 RepID=UPI0006FDC4DD|nr:hypothetical protein [Curtobacterium sp. Leaf261]KQO64644.1 hypothetical protein ASF23_00025 [Curtobacterium sp. Leaf261]
MIHDGWCDDCDDRTVVIDGESEWATCTECGTGWVWRDDIAERAEVAGSRALRVSSEVVQERRAA